MKSLLVAMKYQDMPYLAKSLAAFMLLQHEALGWDIPDIITFVPQSFLRKTMRGYNQSQLLAESLSRLIQRPVMATLTKSAFSPTQTMRSKEERKMVDATSFSPIENAVAEGTHLLLIDDVFTTGATARSASEALRHFSPKQLDVFCLIRTEA
jgi:ComF family protein